MGDGFKNIKRVDSPWSVMKECDLAIFPDIGFADMQAHIADDLRIPVWGARKADTLESNRGKFLKAIEGLGMPVPHYEAIKGIANLRSHLRDKEDKFIKISKWRGEAETFHWRDWAHDEATLDFMAHKLGPWRRHLTFYVLDPIDTDIEGGMDTYCIDGKIPDKCINGFEAKDKAYLCTVTDREGVPEGIRHVTEEFVKLLVPYGYRSLLSTEIRVSGNDNYFIDLTARAGSPPSQCQSELFGNLGDIIWMGANGECIEPKETAKFGVQALIIWKGDKSCWREVSIPEEIFQWVKVPNACLLDGMVCQPPDEDGAFGWLVSTGDTIKETIDTLKEYAGELPDGLSVDLSALGDLLGEAHKAEEEGMEFTSQEVPEPESVIQ